MVSFKERKKGTGNKLIFKKAEVNIILKEVVKTEKELPKKFSKFWSEYKATSIVKYNQANN